MVHQSHQIDISVRFNFVGKLGWIRSFDDGTYRIIQGTEVCMLRLKLRIMESENTRPALTAHDYLFFCLASLALAILVS